ncbi:hypothetical protein BAUCODRAFT_116138 [Baudoinia panamericana UAMH 10762]|uniref:Fe2OG dioxygenase domain-containing protein n=1 Tax=Baudoinia panamericana (strain UAMH 10762) TaxID=717646 RepID=M2MM97_BAUPA|nr:uncharacterized protein BAUCODRAFT_116138 [Baudoinia panamericana UAMH 10762]EMC92488.1 hypothetical protein BAUCODRAFT_116138 [Baudoinia panamericana UAMH 10762]
MTSLSALLSQQTPLQTRKALILLGLQNDFLSPNGKLVVNVESGFLHRLEVLVPAFREFGDIIWVRSEFEANREVNSLQSNGDTVIAGSYNDRGKVDRTKSGSKRRASEDASTSAKRIKSTKPDEDEELFLTRTKSREPCCLRGSWGADYAPDVSKLIDERRDMHLVKTYYSAFGSTSFLTTLRSKLITELYVCGCNTNLSVFATAMDAARYGIKITLVEDCLGYRRQERHDEAIRQLVDVMGAEVMTGKKVIDILSNPPLVHVDDDSDAQDDDEDDESDNESNATSDAGQILDKPAPPTLDEDDDEALVPEDEQDEAAAVQLPSVPEPASLRKTPLFGDGKDVESAGSVILYDLLPADLSESIFEELIAEVKWQKMHHQTGEVPRLVCCQGSVAEDGSMPVYRHPSDETLPLQCWSPSVDKVRRAAEAVVGHPLNHALIQLYRGGQDFISEHSDKTLDIARGSCIVNVSFGAQRTMRLRTKRSAGGSMLLDGSLPPRTTYRVLMPHNSVIVMTLPTNAEYLHGINANKRPAVEFTEAEKAYGGQRISLTFRQIATFLTADEHGIWGQGATGKTQEDARPVINGDETESERLVRAFGAENQASTIDWDAVYGEGSDVLHLRSGARLSGTSRQSA